MELILKLTDEDVKNIISLEDLQAIFKSSKTVTCKSDKEVTYDVEVTEKKVTVPTTDKSYSLDELSKAAVMLMDMGKQNELLSVLNNEFGVPAMPQLTKEQYPAFANKLREMGADI